MAQSLKITDVKEVEGFLEQNLSPKLNPTQRMTAMLICEELAVQLFQSGNSELSLSVKGIGKSWIEIMASAPLSDNMEKNVSESEKMEGEIRGEILKRYESCIDQIPVDDGVCYRIDPANRWGNLADDIFEYYHDDWNEKKKPIGVIAHIASKRKLFIGVSVLIRTIKHLCALLLPVFAARMIDTLTTCKSFWEAPVLLNILGAALALIVNLILATEDAYIYQHFVRCVEAGFKMAIVQKLQVLSIRYYGENSSGKILSKLASDVQFIKLLMVEQMQTILHLGIDIVFVIVMSLIKMPAMLIFFAVVMPASALICRHYMKPIMVSKANMRKRTEVSNAAFKEMLAMESLTRAHGVQQTEYQQVSSKVMQVESAAVRQDRLQLKLNNAVYSTSQGFRLLCVSIAIYLAFRGSITVASVVLFASLFDALIGSVQKFLDDIPQITQELDSLASIDEILREQDLEQNGTEILPEPVKGDVCFENVSFRYSDDGPFILHGASFHVPAGQYAALVGKSGSGKSTLLSLLLGLYSPQSGTIRIDGMDLNSLDKANYRRHLAVVPQTSVLFTGTLWDNLVYGLKYVSVDRVMEALRSVGLEELVAEHPDGLMRPIMENGENLSGGQRQRVSIARALLRNPSIIIFDEATSALDPESERQVQEAIEHISGRCTLIVVAHRLHTIRNADLFFQVEDDTIKQLHSIDDLDKEKLG